MGLETGDFIDDLDLTNPITATDPVSEGAAHIRLLKKVLLQSFPGVDDVVNLTSAQLNDAALKSVDQTIGGFWRHDAALRLANNIGLEAFQIDDATLQTLARISTGDVAQLGSPNLPLLMRVSKPYQVALDGVVSLDLTAGIDFGLQVEVQAGGGALSRVPTLADPNTFAGLNTFNTQLRMGNNVQVSSRNAALSSEIPLIKLDSSDRIVIGDPVAQQINQCATQNQFIVDGITVAFMVALNSGGIQVKDRAGVSRKVGFRDPAPISNPSTIIQDYESKTITQLGSTSRTWTINALEEGTNIIIINQSTAPQELVPGTASVSWVDPAGLGNVSSLVIASNGVAQLYWRASGSCVVWGSAISVTP